MGLNVCQSLLLEIFCLREKYKESFIFETCGEKILKMMHHTDMYETIRDINEKKMMMKTMHDLPPRVC